MDNHDPRHVALRGTARRVWPKSGHSIADIAKTADKIIAKNAARRVSRAPKKVQE